MLLSLRSLYERSGGGPRTNVGRIKVTSARRKKLQALQGMMALALASKDLDLIKSVAREYNREMGS